MHLAIEIWHISQLRKARLEILKAYFSGRDRKRGIKTEPKASKVLRFGDQ